MRRYAPVCLLLSALLSVPLHAEEERRGPVEAVHMTAEAARAAGLTTAPLLRDTVVGEMPLLLRVVPDVSRDVRIRPSGRGQVIDVRVHPGDRVRSGDVLFTYRNHSLHAASLEAGRMQAALAAAQALRDQDAAAYERAQKLAGETVSLGEVRRRRDALRAAEADVRARRNDVATLDYRLHKEFRSASETSVDHDATEVTAPVDGIVESLSAAVSQTIGPDMDVARVTDLSTVWLAADVSPDEAAGLSPGGEVRGVTPSGAFRTGILSINAADGAASGLVRVLCQIDNSSGAFVPGMVFSAVAKTRRREMGLVVPSEAIRSVNGETVIFVAEKDDAYRPVPVSVLMETDAWSVIASPALTGRETVVGQGSLALKALIVLGGMGDDD